MALGISSQFAVGLAPLCLNFGQEICPLNRYGYGNSGGGDVRPCRKRNTVHTDTHSCLSTLNKQINECVEVQICL